jgi:hypothetical protein
MMRSKVLDFLLGIDLLDLCSPRRRWDGFIEKERGTEITAVPPGREVSCSNPLTA